MKHKTEKRHPKNISEVADSQEVTILDENLKVVKVGTWREFYAQAKDDQALYLRTHELILKNRILIR